MTVLHTSTTKRTSGSSPKAQPKKSALRAPIDPVDPLYRDIGDYLEYERLFRAASELSERHLKGGSGHEYIDGMMSSVSEWAGSTFGNHLAGQSRDATYWQIELDVWKRKGDSDFTTKNFRHLLQNKLVLLHRRKALLESRDDRAAFHHYEKNQIGNVVSYVLSPRSMNSMNKYVEVQHWTLDEPRFNAHRAAIDSEMVKLDKCLALVNERFKMAIKRFDDWFSRVAALQATQFSERPIPPRLQQAIARRNADRSLVAANEAALIARGEKKAPGITQAQSAPKSVALAMTPRPAVRPATPRPPTVVAQKTEARTSKKKPLEASKKLHIAAAKPAANKSAVATKPLVLPNKTIAATKPHQPERPPAVAASRSRVPVAEVIRNQGWQIGGSSR